MSDVVSVHDAKTRLSHLLDRVEAGEEIIISRQGRPVARLAPLALPRARRVPACTGRGITVPEDFDEFTDQDDSDWHG